jgi:hypothetical protein
MGISAKIALPATCNDPPNVPPSEELLVAVVLKGGLLLQTVVFGPHVNRLPKLFTSFRSTEEIPSDVPSS